MSNAGWPVPPPYPADGIAPPVVHLIDDPPEVARDEEAEDAGGQAPPSHSEAVEPGDAVPDSPPSLGAPDEPESPPGDIEELDETPDDLKLRRRRGELEQTVADVLIKIASGEIAIAEALTPHFVGRAVAQYDTARRKPSIGALTSIFQGWERDSIAVFTKEPYAFVRFANDELADSAVRAAFRKAS